MTYDTDGNEWWQVEDIGAPVGTERWVSAIKIVRMVFEGYNPILPLQLRKINPTCSPEDYGVLMVKTEDTLTKRIDEAITSKKPIIEAETLDNLTTWKTFKLFLDKFFVWRFKVYSIFRWYRWFLSVILRRRLEGERYKYGPNWDINRHSITLVLFLPLRVYPVKIFEDIHSRNLLRGRRVLKLKIRFRWSWKVGKVFFDITKNKEPGKTVFVMSSERVEDGRPHERDREERKVYDKIMSNDIDWLPKEGNDAVKDYEKKVKARIMGTKKVKKGY